MDKAGAVRIAGQVSTLPISSQPIPTCRVAVTPVTETRRACNAAYSKAVCVEVFSAEIGSYLSPASPFFEHTVLAPPCSTRVRHRWSPLTPGSAVTITCTLYGAVLRFRSTCALHVGSVAFLRASPRFVRASSPSGLSLSPSPYVVAPGSPESHIDDAFLSTEFVLAKKGALGKVGPRAHTSPLLRGMLCHDTRPRPHP